MSDFDDDYVNLLTPASTPTLSAESDCELDNKADEVFQGPSRAENIPPLLEDPTQHAVPDSSSSIGNDPLIANRPYESQGPWPDQSFTDCNGNEMSVRVGNTIYDDFGPSYIRESGFVPLEITFKAPPNIDQISHCMNRVSLCGHNTIASTSKVFSPCPTSCNPGHVNMNQPPAMRLDAPTSSSGQVFPGPSNPDRMIPGPSRLSQSEELRTMNKCIRKKKRVRIAFTTQQLEALENEFTKSRYIDRNARINMARSLALTEKSVKVWFQNRRMKDKKCVNEEEANTDAYNSIKFEDNDEGYQLPSTSAAVNPQSSMRSTMNPSVAKAKPFIPQHNNNFMVPSYPYMPYMPASFPAPIVPYTQMPTPQNFPPVHQSPMSVHQMHMHFHMQPQPSGSKAQSSATKQESEMELKRQDMSMKIQFDEDI